VTKRKKKTRQSSHFFRDLSQIYWEYRYILLNTN